MRIVGIDPGIHGGLALVLTYNQGADKLIDAIDIPVVGVKAKERVDVLTLRAWLLAARPDGVVIERAQAMPKQGASSGFKYGRAVGAIEATVISCEIPITIIEPRAWKSYLQLHQADKEASRQLALQMFPRQHIMLARKMDHGRAEAALIAVYAARQGHIFARGDA